MVLFLILGGFTLSFVVSAQGIGHGLAEFMLRGNPNPWVVMADYSILLILMGMVMDPGAIVVITMPILFPVFMEMGFDPVWLGVVTTINAEIGMITPPVGLNLFVLKGVVPPDVQMEDIVLGSLLYVLALIVALALIMAVPQLSLWLPGLASNV